MPTQFEGGLDNAQLEKLKGIFQNPEAKAQMLKQMASGGPPPGDHPLDQQIAAGQGAPAQFVPGESGGVPQGAQIGPQVPPDRSPKTPQEFETNMSRWEERLARIADPASTESFLFNTGLGLTQAPAPGQSPLGQAAEVLTTQAQRLGDARRQRRVDAEQAEVRGVKLEQARAQTEGVKAETQQTQRETESIAFDDELKQAQAELARARARAEGKDTGKTAGDAKVALDKAKVIAWYNANPGKFVDLDDARADLIRFETTNGKSAYSDAMEALLQDASLLKIERLKPVIEMVKKESKAEEARPVSTRRAAADRLGRLSPEEWERVRTDPDVRKVLDDAFGAETVDSFLNRR